MDIREIVREACAKACDDISNGYLDASIREHASAAKYCANAIRSLDLDKIAPLLEPNWNPVPIRACVTPTHEAADAFWKYWKENGETHRHGYYESTWGAINAALAVGYTVPIDQSERIKELEADLNAAKQVIEDIVTSEVEPAVARAENAEDELAKQKQDGIAAMEEIAVHISKLDAELAEARKSVADMMLRQGFATGHGDTVGDMIGELEPEIVKMRAELAEARKDVERIDWIERNLFERRWNAVIDSGSSYYWSVRGDYRHTVKKLCGPRSFREAIDAALAQEQKP